MGNVKEISFKEGELGTTKEVTENIMKEISKQTKKEVKEIIEDRKVCVKYVKEIDYQNLTFGNIVQRKKKKERARESFIVGKKKEKEKVDSEVKIEDEKGILIYKVKGIEK